jgi:phage-related protein
MPAIGSGVSEVRVHGQDGQFRTFYFMTGADGILVPHAFVKKTRATPAQEIKLATRRLKEMLADEN